MKVYLASDHAGFEHKEALKKYLLAKEDITVVDSGPEQYDQDDDYPDTIAPAARAVARDSFARAVIFGGSGQGEAIVANKFPRVRAAVYYGSEAQIVTLSREHNDANVLSIGARFVDVEEMKQVVDIWLSSSFTHKERHERRLGKLRMLENRLYSFLTKQKYNRN